MNYVQCANAHVLYCLLNSEIWIISAFRLQQITYVSADSQIEAEQAVYIQFKYMRFYFMCFDFFEDEVGWKGKCNGRKGLDQFPLEKFIDTIIEFFHKQLCLSSGGRVTN